MDKKMSASSKHHHHASLWKLSTKQVSVSGLWASSTQPMSASAPLEDTHTLLTPIPRHHLTNHTLHLVQHHLASTVPSTGCNGTKKRLEIHVTRRLPLPHRRTITSLHRNRRAEVRARSGSHRPGSSATENSRFKSGTMA